MTNPFKKIIENNSWLQFLGNKYFIVTLFFIVWMVFLDNYSYLDHRLLNKQIDESEDNKQYYKEEIAKDKQSIKKLKNPAEIERYAREKYYMKKENEDIYIIEFEGDTIE
ncbi:MAG: septum formation initiator family protein [Bacteroidota bacterium]